MYNKVPQTNDPPPIINLYIRIYIQKMIGGFPYNLQFTFYYPTQQLILLVSNKIPFLPKIFLNGLNGLLDIIEIFPNATTEFISFLLRIDHEHNLFFLITQAFSGKRSNHLKPDTNLKRLFFIIT